MSVLSNTRHEQFAQALTRGLSATKAYISAGYAKKGARQNASRLMTDDAICARVKQLQTTIAAGVIALEISNRNARVQALQDAFDRVSQIIDARAKDKTMAHVPGGATGLLVRDYKGKKAVVPVYRADTALLAELRAIMRQAAEELGQWGPKREPSSFNVTEMTERLNAGRRRVREDWERRQALNSGTQKEA